MLVDSGCQIFLDAKLLDIDNTVGSAVANIVRIGMTFVTVHAYPKAMRAAVAARGDAPLGLLAVTVLTSMDDGDLERAGYAGKVEDIVLDKMSNHIMFAVVSCGGVMGMGEKHLAVPWGSLDYDKDENAYCVSQTKDQLKAAPADTIDELTRGDSKRKPFWK